MQPIFSRVERNTIVVSSVHHVGRIVGNPETGDTTGSEDIRPVKSAGVELQSDVALKVRG